MQFPVLVEPVGDNGYRAPSGEPLPLTAEGDTPEAAVKKLEEQLVERLTRGTWLLAVELPTTSHPSAPMAGIYEKEPLFEEWQETIAEHTGGWMMPRQNCHEPFYSRYGHADALPA